MRSGLKTKASCRYGAGDHGVLATPGRLTRASQVKSLKIGIAHLGIRVGVLRLLALVLHKLLKLLDKVGSA